MSAPTACGPSSSGGSESKAGEKDLTIDEILRAQEPATYKQYDGIKLTPFNLDEELEEGRFDESGTYILNRDEEESDGEQGNDNWAESIDWSAVERKEQEAKDRLAAEQMDAFESVSKPTSKPESRYDKIECYKQMLRIMHFNETIQRTIKRLGNSVPKKRPPFKKNAPKPMEVDQVVDCEVVEARRKLDLMIELAHQRLEDGDVDIYQKTYEDLEEAINQ